MAKVAFSLGSNVGDGALAIGRALAELSTITSGLRASSLYRTVPMYVTDQPPFLNAAAIGECSLGPWPLLKWLKQFEAELGRVSRYRWGPREIDIDLVIYGALEYRFEKEGETILQVPHQRAHERRFVLLPLSQIDPACIIPGRGRVLELLEQTEGQARDVVKETDELLPIRSAG